MAILIYLISFLEWFTTLSIEIIAIRNFTPIIWTNSISTSIILWVILLALSYGYYIWWKNTKDKNKNDLINLIVKNLAISSLYYLLFTFTFDKFILTFLLEYIWNYFISILFSSIILFFVPIFLASQTIPLLSEVLKWNNTWEKIWKLLFFSTIWSFLWSILTSSLLFPILWVEKTAIFNSLILSLIIILLSIKKIKEFNFFNALWISIFIFCLFLIFSKEEKKQNIIFQKANSYHNINIYETKNKQRIFWLNWWYSSWIKIETKQSFFGYIKEIKNEIIKNHNQNILIIWAAWFTLPHELSKVNNIKKIDVVDVDKDLKEISEKYFLKEKLSEKIIFFSNPSRYFINKSINENKKYDSIVVDVYVWKSLPSQTLTYEFFKDLNQLWNSIYLNIITDKNLDSNFSKKLFKTINTAFWSLYYKNASSWQNSKSNFVISNKYISWYNKYLNNENVEIYTDNKNTIEVDLFNLNSFK